LAELHAIEGEYPYKVTVLDGMTGLIDVCMRDVLYTSRKGMALPTRSGGSMENATMEEWGLLISRIQDFLPRFTGLPNITVITCHLQVWEDQSEGKLMRAPSVPGKKLPGQISPWFDEVYNFETFKMADDARDKGEWSDTPEDNIGYQAITKALKDKEIGRSAMHCLNRIEPQRFEVWDKKWREKSEANVGGITDMSFLFLSGMGKGKTHSLKRFPRPMFGFDLDNRWKVQMAGEEGVTYEVFRDVVPKIRQAPLPGVVKKG